MNFQGSLSIVQLSKFSVSLPLSRDSYIRLSHPLVSVKHFFESFLFFSNPIIFHLFIALKKAINKTEKEGFEPSRRLPDLHP